MQNQSPFKCSYQKHSQFQSVQYFGSKTHQLADTQLIQQFRIQATPNQNQKLYKFNNSQQQNEELPQCPYQLKQIVHKYKVNNKSLIQLNQRLAHNYSELELRHQSIRKQLRNNYCENIHEIRVTYTSDIQTYITKLSIYQKDMQISNKKIQLLQNQITEKSKQIQIMNRSIDLLTENSKLSNPQNKIQMKNKQKQNILSSSQQIFAISMKLVQQQHQTNKYKMKYQQTITQISQLKAKIQQQQHKLAITQKQNDSIKIQNQYYLHSIECQNIQIQQYKNTIKQLYSQLQRAAQQINSIYYNKWKEVQILLNYQRNKNEDHQKREQLYKKQIQKFKDIIEQNNIKLQSVQQQIQWYKKLLQQAKSDFIYSQLKKQETLQKFKHQNTQLRKYINQIKRVNANASKSKEKQVSIQNNILKSKQIYRNSNYNNNNNSNGKLSVRRVYNNEKDKQKHGNSLSSTKLVKSRMINGYNQNASRKTSINMKKQQFQQNLHQIQNMNHQMSGYEATKIQNYFSVDTPIQKIDKQMTPYQQKQMSFENKNIQFHYNSKNMYKLNNKAEYSMVTQFIEQNNSNINNISYQDCDKQNNDRTNLPKQNFKESKTQVIRKFIKPKQQLHSNILTKRNSLQNGLLINNWQQISPNYYKNKEQFEEIQKEEIKQMKLNKHQPSKLGIYLKGNTKNQNLKGRK